MVKYGRKSEQYINGVIMLQKESCQYFNIDHEFCKVKSCYITDTEIRILNKKLYSIQKCELQNNPTDNRV
jgi:hypothetical protein